MTGADGGEQQRGDSRGGPSGSSKFLARANRSPRIAAAGREHNARTVRRFSLRAGALWAAGPLALLSLSLGLGMAACHRQAPPIAGVPDRSTSTSTSSRSSRTAASSATVRTSARARAALRLDMQASALGDAGVGPSRRRAGQHVEERAGPPHPQHRSEGDDAGAGFAPRARRRREGDAGPLDRTGRRMEAALGVHSARRRRRRRRSRRAAGRGARSIASCSPRSRRRAGSRRPKRRARRWLRRVSLRPDRPAAGCRRDRRVPRRPLRRRLRDASSIACWRRRPTASAWPPTGWTSRATPTRTATRTTACARCGRGATG